MSKVTPRFVLLITKRLCSHFSEARRVKGTLKLSSDTWSVGGEKMKLSLAKQRRLEKDSYVYLTSKSIHSSFVSSVGILALLVCHRCRCTFMLSSFVSFLLFGSSYRSENVYNQHTPWRIRIRRRRFMDRKFFPFFIVWPEDYRRRSKTSNGRKEIMEKRLPDLLSFKFHEVKSELCVFVQDRHCAWVDSCQADFRIKSREENKWKSNTKRTLDRIKALKAYTVHDWGLRVEKEKNSDEKVFRSLLSPSSTIMP